MLRPPAKAEAGIRWPVVTVELTDGAGTRDTGATDTVTLTGPDGGRLAIAAVAGLVTFPWVFHSAVTSLVCAATAVGLTAAPNFTVDVTAIKSTRQTGVNGQSHTDSNARYFKDSIRQSRIFPATEVMDSNGWATEIAAGESNVQYLTMIGPVDYPEGTWHLRYTGDSSEDARISIVGGSGLTSFSDIGGGVREATFTADTLQPGLRVRIDRLGSDHATNAVPIGITDVRLVHEDFVSDFATDPFLPEVVQNLSHFSVFRNLDWNRINECGHKEFSAVTPYDYARQHNKNVQYVDAKHGGNYQLFFELCNAASVDAWLCVPLRASDAYVTALANEALTYLDSHLKVYVEYSNELWNSQFFQGDEIIYRATVLVDTQTIAATPARSVGTVDVATAGNPWQCELGAWIGWDWDDPASFVVRIDDGTSVRTAQAAGEYRTDEYGKGAVVHLEGTGIDTSESYYHPEDGSVVVVTDSGVCVDSTVEVDYYKLSSGQPFNDRYEYQAKRSVEIFDLFEAVLGLPRIVRLCALQSGAPTAAEKVLDYVYEGTKITAEKVDAFAVNGYMGSHLGNPNAYLGTAFPTEVTFATPSVTTGWAYTDSTRSLTAPSGHGLTSGDEGKWLWFDARNDGGGNVLIPGGTQGGQAVWIQTVTGDTIKLGVNSPGHLSYECDGLTDLVVGTAPGTSWDQAELVKELSGTPNIGDLNKAKASDFTLNAVDRRSNEHSAFITAMAAYGVRTIIYEGGNHLVGFSPDGNGLNVLSDAIQNTSEMATILRGLWDNFWSYGGGVYNHFSFMSPEEGTDDGDFWWGATTGNNVPLASHSKGAELIDLGTKQGALPHMEGDAGFRNIDSGLTCYFARGYDGTETFTVTVTDGIGTPVTSGSQSIPAAGGAVAVTGLDLTEFATGARLTVTVTITISATPYTFEQQNDFVLGVPAVQATRKDYAINTGSFALLLTTGA